jgi:maltose alpha-D-glucosyltransferase/alpha-amylase
MLYSFHAAADAAGRKHADRRGDPERHWHWIEVLARVAAGLFWEAYWRRAAGAAFLPESAEDRDLLLNAYLIEKAVQELGRALGNDGEAEAPLRGLSALLAS